MKRLALLLVLAACPQKNASNPQPQAAGAGCPPASGVYVASYASTGQGQGHWVVPLHSKAGAGAQLVDYAQIDPSVASAAGVPPAPQGTLWLATANGAHCKAKVGAFYSAKIEGPPQSVSYGVELEGCAAPANPDEAGGIVLVSDQVPTGCHFEQPQPIAARVGELDAQKQWQRPTKETPLPPEIAAAIPEHTCNAPDCEKLYAFGAVKVDGKPVAWSGAVNWLQIGAPADRCNWKAERFSGFFVPSQGGAVKVTEGQDHPLVLSAALVDSGGAKVLLAEGPGEYATYDLTADGAKLGHQVRWMIAPNEAWDAVDSLVPPCEPAQP